RILARSPLERPGEDDGLPGEGPGRGGRTRRGHQRRDPGPHQLVEKLLFLRSREVLLDALGDDAADALDRLQLVDRNASENVNDRAEGGVLGKSVGEPPREIVGGGVAHVADAEGEKDPRKRAALRGLDPLVDIACALFRESVELAELLLGQEEEIRGIVDQALFLKLRDECPANAFDVHAATRNEMPDPLSGLGRTGWVPAVVRDLALRMNHLAATDRAL